MFSKTRIDRGILYDMHEDLSKSLFREKVEKYPNMA